MQGERSDNPGKGRILARVAGVVALLVAVVLVAIVLFGGDKGYSYKLLFETGGQLVAGNQVLVGGQPIGTVDEISLTEDSQAEVKITVDDPLHDGTTAVIRATSLSGIANRYVSISPGPNNEPEIAVDDTIPSTETTSPVDIDQLFNTFNTKTRKGLADFIQGQGTVYTNNAKQANKAYKFLAPGLQSTERLLAELTRDEQTFSDFLASGSSVLGALAERRNDLSQLTSNANEALGAIAEQNEAFDRSLVALPPALRQANTTFVNLRAALDDLDPVIAATGRAEQAGLTSFLRRFGSVAEDSVPVFKNLGLVLHRDGPANDLVDTLGALPGAQRRASTAVPANIKALDDSQPNIAQLRPYTPDLLGFLARFGQSASNYDGNGHYVRVQPSGINLFRWNSATSVLDPIPTTEQFADFDNGFFNRCPGAGTQPICRLEPVPRRRRPRRRLQPGRHPAGTMKRVAAILVALVASAVILLVGSGAGGDDGNYEVRGDLRQRLVPGRGRGGPDRGRDRRRRQGGHGHRRGRARARGRQPRSGQGRGRDADRRPGLPGLPHRRLLPDPPAVAARREVRRVQADRARARRAREPPPALEVIERRRAGRGRAPPAGRAQRHVGRPRPGQQHHARALRGPVPADPQLRSAPGSPPAATTSPRSSTARTRRCARRTRCSRSSPSRTSSWRSWRATATRCSRRSPATASGSAAFINSADETAEATAERGAELEQNFALLPGDAARGPLDDEPS